MTKSWILAIAGAACAGPPVEPKEWWQDVAPVPAERPICGWEEVEKGTPQLSVSASGEERASPGATVLILEAAPDAGYSAVQAALEPAADSLVRVKIAFDGRWLLPTTFPQRHRQPPKPPPEDRVVRVVGKRQITRSVKRPAERFAELRLDGDDLELYVENDAPRGRSLALGKLAQALRETEPPAQVFAVTATEATPWRTVVAAIRTAACYDRAPGDEPHEVILD